MLGEPAIRVRSGDGAEATVLLHGGHVVSWKPPGAGEQLYLSPRAEAGQGRAVRGGVPVIFPQFDRRGPDLRVPRHGFARTHPWTPAPESGTEAGATLWLCDDEATRALWPHRFALSLRVDLAGPRMELTLVVENVDETPWAFTGALHTYLRVDDVSRARVVGLLGCRFWDNVAGQSAEERDAERDVSGEIDRVYADATELTLEDGARRIAIASEGLSDAVIWNPGPEKCRELADMPTDGWRSMLCVEAAHATQPLTLAPGERFQGRQTLTLLGG